MIISLGWIKEYVKLPSAKDVYDFANDLTLSTAEVELVEAVKNYYQLVHVVEVLEIHPHPNAQKLKLVSFTNGKDTKKVVCGAENVRPGIKVFFAPIGTHLPNEMKLEAKEIRGVLSEGMLCSAGELKLPQKSDGLLELPAASILGTSFAQFYQFESDELIHLDNKSLTHRPDLWGIYGFAREFSAIYQEPLRPILSSERKNYIEKLLLQSKQSDLKVIIDKDSSCSHFNLIKISKINNRISSPPNIKNRLESLGVKSINFIVDLTNYVMLESGIPLHAYDAAKVILPLKIAPLKSEIQFHFLDGKERLLSDGDIIISDTSKPLVLAGIMGGATCSVQEDTTDIFLEAAIWDATRIRLTSTKLGLRTESSSRFEKTLDPVTANLSIYRFIDLLLNIDSKIEITSSLFQHSEKTVSDYPISFPILLKRIEDKLDIKLTQYHLDYLKYLGFKLEKKSGGSGNDDFIIHVPSFRATKDVSIEQDILEELSRMIGFSNLPVKSPHCEIIPLGLSKEKNFQRKIQDYFSLHCNAFETMSYPLIGKKLLDSWNWTEENLDHKLVNFLSEDADRLRPSLIPGLLAQAIENSKYQSSFNLFEIGRSYRSSNKGLEDRLERHDLLFLRSSKWENQFPQLLDDLTNLFQFLKVPYKFLSGLDVNKKIPLSLICSTTWLGLHPKELIVIESMGKIVGFATTVHPLLLKDVNSKHFVSFFILDTTTLSTRSFEKKVLFQSIEEYPSSYFDCCMVITEDVAADSGIRAVEELKNVYINSTKILEIYHSPDNNKFITYRTHFSSKNETLSADKIKIIEQEILIAMNKKGLKLKEK